MSMYSDSESGRTLMIAGDLVNALLAFAAARFLRFGPQGLYDLAYPHIHMEGAVIACVFVACAYIFDVYNFGIHRDKWLIAKNILEAAIFSLISLAIIYYLHPPVAMGRGVLGLTLITFMTLQYLWHAAFAAHFSRVIAGHKVMILGTGALAEKIGLLLQTPDLQVGHSFVGYAADRDDPFETAVPAEQIICSLDDLSHRAEALGVTHIVVAAENYRDNADLHQQLLSCRLNGIRVQNPPTFFENRTGKLLLESMDLSWLIFSDGFRRSSLTAAIKRQTDILLAVIGLLMTLPLFPLIALLVKVNAPGPIFYAQTRVGQWGKPFQLYKFRSMPTTSEAQSGAVWAQENDPRIRPIGSFLRRYRIDELPQLFNILKGDMSFVGPRPERPEFVAELEKIIPLYGKRHMLKPGLTGWAQISFPYGASVEDSYEKLRYDLYYFKHMSLVFDALILAKTFKVVLFGTGGR